MGQNPAVLGNIQAEWGDRGDFYKIKEIKVFFASVVGMMNVTFSSSAVNQLALEQVTAYFQLLWWRKVNFRVSTSKWTKFKWTWKGRSFRMWHVWVLEEQCRPVGQMYLCRWWQWEEYVICKSFVFFRSKNSPFFLLIFSVCSVKRKERIFSV